MCLSEKMLSDEQAHYGDKEGALDLLSKGQKQAHYGDKAIEVPLPP